MHIFHELWYGLINDSVYFAALPSQAQCCFWAACAPMLYTSVPISYPNRYKHNPVLCALCPNSQCVVSFDQEKFIMWSLPPKREERSQNYYHQMQIQINLMKMWSPSKFQKQTIAEVFTAEYHNNHNWAEFFFSDPHRELLFMSVEVLHKMKVH